MNLHALRILFAKPDGVNSSVGAVFYSNKTKNRARVIAPALTLTLFLWCHLELNQGHQDFQSCALPTELWHQHVVLLTKRGKFKQIFQMLQDI